MSNSGKTRQANIEAALFALTLDRDGPAPMHVQLSEALRGLILSGAARPGAALPASRTLAAELSVSRATVQTALDQLAAEGFLEGRRGAGVFVAAELPEAGVAAAPPPLRRAVPETPAPPRPFRLAIPDPALFPHRDWARRLERAWRHPPAALTGPPAPFGWPPLRAAIAAHLAAWRGLDAAPDSVVVTSGAAEAFRLIAAAGFAPGDEVILEAPGFGPTRAALLRAGLRLTDARADEQGLDVEAALAAAPRARGVVLSPARHYPTGATLPLARRLALLDWAARTGALIVEDDYDGEFRYRGQPLPALAALDRAGRTIYVGSFSKVLTPTLRLGLLAAPESLLPRLRAAMAETGPSASIVPQPALAGFIADGAFAQHLRRMRRAYARRQEALLAAIALHCDGLLEAAPDPAGMHLVARLSPTLGLTDCEAAARAAAAGVEARALSSYWPEGREAPQALLLGYAGFDESALEEAAGRLGAALRGEAAGLNG